jgi:hypothetical protein
LIVDVNVHTKKNAVKIGIGPIPHVHVSVRVTDSVRVQRYGVNITAVAFVQLLSLLEVALLH